MLLFVYGLLRKGSSHPMSIYLAANAKYISEGFIEGSLHLISHYPGAIIKNDGRQIIGDIYNIEDASLWKEIDAFEGLPYSHEYRKELVEVKTVGGLKECVIYVYNRPANNLMQIESGDFLSYTAETNIKW